MYSIITQCCYSCSRAKPIIPNNPMRTSIINEIAINTIPTILVLSLIVKGIIIPTINNATAAAPFLVTISESVLR